MPLPFSVLLGTVTSVRQEPSSLYTFYFETMSQRKYSDTKFIEAIRRSTSYRQALAFLGLKPAGGNYTALKRRITQLGLNTSHMTGQGWNRGLVRSPKLPLSDYLNNKRSIQSHKLKLRLLREGLFEHKCYHCEATTWLGQPIPLELEHRNGNPQDNSLDNLTLLCPNCHALTATYRGKNKKSK